MTKLHHGQGLIQCGLLLGVEAEHFSVDNELLDHRHHGGVLLKSEMAAQECFLHKVG